jgi:hypothetical protein
MVAILRGEGRVICGLFHAMYVSMNGESLDLHEGPKVIDSRGQDRLCGMDKNSEATSQVNSSPYDQLHRLGRALEEEGGFYVRTGVCLSPDACLG